jgi:hypothetical protein
MQRIVNGKTLEESLAEFLANPAAPNGYAADDVTLMDYHTEYLQSNLWRKIKRRVLKRDGHTCQLCEGKGNVVHHKSYERNVLEGAADNLLITLCEGCHNIVHFNELGEKRSCEQQEKVLAEKQLQQDFPEPKIDLRRRIQTKPKEWARMTAIQRALWRNRCQQLYFERKVAMGHEKFSTYLKNA